MSSMTDLFIIRVMLAVLAIIAFYAIAAIAACTIAKALEARRLCRRYGYPWSVAWGIARANAAIEKRLRRKNA